MKNFKFRAWLKKQKRMREVVMVDFELGGVWVQYSKNHNVFKDFKEVELMMGTDIRDKNNNIIFEGDILRQYDGTKRVVGFKNGSFVYTNIPKLNQAHNTFSMFWAESEEWEIVGNIYENREKCVID